MTESEARDRVAALVPRETVDRLDLYAALLCLRAAEQNLIAASTLPHIWSRHFLDSAQLLPHATESGVWLDLGAGAGLPGLVIAAAGDRKVMLIEPRAKRCAFLSEAVSVMQINDLVEIVQSRAETAPPTCAAVISARAVAPLPALFKMGQRFANRDTRWLLLKGRSAAREVAAARGSWQADIKLVPSITDSEASIVVASNVRPGRRS